MEPYGKAEVQFHAFIMSTVDGRELHALAAPSPGRRAGDTY
jgi:hypothetical protein